MKEFILKIVNINPINLQSVPQQRTFTKAVNPVENNLKYQIFQRYVCYTQIL
ncbi:hypothetical protein HMPREF1548_04147 [Clostridium sp. KLE 1755]|nr:hypothetical protein HMPREF1548_04147 [Clostridium sp. KLE 1755]